MSRFQIIVALVIVVIVVVLAVVTNPSEDQHRDAMVRAVVRREAEHVRSCPDCELPVMSVEHGREAMELYAPPSLHRKSYGFFSVYTNGSAWESLTFGAFGVVMGPNITAEHPCQGTFDIAMPEDPESLTQVLTFQFQVDGTLWHDEKPIDEAKLGQLAEQIEDKQTTGIVFNATSECKHIDLVRVQELFRDFGFESVVARITAP